MAENHTVRQGECLADITKQYGFQDYRTIWDHPRNSALKSRRQNPNILAEDDVVYIPDKREKEDPRGVDQRHSFQVDKAKVLYRTIIRDARDNPLANTTYTLKVGGETFTGATGGDGLLEQEIPMAAETAEVRLDDLGVTWTVHFGHLDPVDTASGVRQRLKSLGYPPDTADGNVDEGLRAALRAFQKDNSLPVDGECAPATRAKIKEKYGC